MLFNGLPLFKAVVGEAEGMVVCSFVDDPAIEKDFIAFEKDEMPLEFAVQDEDKHIVFGVAMRANYPIFRHSERGDFYIMYTPETIREMVQKFFADNRQNNVDLNHSFELEEGVHIVQAFIKDTEKGINPAGFEDCNDGSLFFEYKVDNETIWQAIKDGTYKGFSIAGRFALEETFAKQEMNNDNKENRFMTKLQRLKDALRTLLVEVEFGSVVTDKGVIVWDSDDEDLVEGMEVHTVGENGESQPIEDGDYVTDDGKTIVVVDGKVSEIKDNEAEVADEPEAEPENEESQENAENEPVSEDEPQDEETPAEDEKDAEIERLRARIAELEAENEELKARIADLEKEPAAESAEEAFEKQVDNKPLTKRQKMEKQGYKFNY